MPIGTERLNEIVSYYSENGESETLKKYNTVSAESLHRYLRNKRFLETKIPKILLFDIETSPCVVYSWGLGKQRLSYENLIEEWCIIAWSAMWLNETTVMGDVLTPEEATKKDDLRIVKSLLKLINDADVLIAHNGRKFDVPRVMGRAIMHKLPPTSSYHIIDTLEAAKKVKFTSNRLDYLGSVLSGEGKIKTTFDLWLKCLHGDNDALNEMLTYNKKDVLVLKEFYLLIRPYIKSHPNVALMSEINGSACPVCGSTEFEEIGDYITQANKYDEFRCIGCGHIFHSPHSNLTTVQRKQLMRSNAR